VLIAASLDLSAVLIVLGPVRQKNLHRQIDFNASLEIDKPGALLQVPSG